MHATPSARHNICVSLTAQAPLKAIVRPKVCVAADQDYRPELCATPAPAHHGLHDRELEGPRAAAVVLGSGRVVASEKEVPYLLVNMA